MIEFYRHRKTGVVVQILYHDDSTVQYRLRDGTIIVSDYRSGFDDQYEPAPPLPPARAIVAEGKTLVCRSCGATSCAAVDPDQVTDMNEARRLISQLGAQVQELQEDGEDSYATLMRLGTLLTNVAEALKGKPAALTSHDWSDLPQRAADTMASLRQLLTRIDQLTEGSSVYEVEADRALALLEPLRRQHRREEQELGDA